MAQPDRQRFTAGMALILVGLGFFLVQKLETVGHEIVMLLIGAAFLVAYFYQKAYVLLLPAGVLLGLGAGNLIRRRAEPEASPVVPAGPRPPAPSPPEPSVEAESDRGASARPDQ